MREHDDARVREVLAKRDQVVGTAQRADVEQHDRRRMLRRDRLDVAQRHVACHKVQTRIVLDQDGQPDGDEILELARDYRCHGAHNG